VRDSVINSGAAPAASLLMSSEASLRVTMGLMLPSTQEMTLCTYEQTVGDEKAMQVRKSHCLCWKAGRQRSAPLLATLTFSSNCPTFSS